MLQNTPYHTIHAIPCQLVVPCQQRMHSPPAIPCHYFIPTRHAIPSQHAGTCHHAIPCPTMPFMPCHAIPCPVSGSSGPLSGSKGARTTRPVHPATPHCHNSPRGLQWLRHKLTFSLLLAPILLCRGDRLARHPHMSSREDVKLALGLKS